MLCPQGLGIRCSRMDKGQQQWRDRAWGPCRVSRAWRGCLGPLTVISIFSSLTIICSLQQNTLLAPVESIVIKSSWSRAGMGNRTTFSLHRIVAFCLPSSFSRNADNCMWPGAQCPAGVLPGLMQWWSFPVGFSAPNVFPLYSLLHASQRSWSNSAWEAEYTLNITAV